MARHAPFVAAVASTLVLGLGAPSARADPLTLTTQLGAWEDAVAALRANLGSEGSTLRVSVRAGGVRVPCERYLLQLDEAAGSAFRATTCDPATQETWLVLARRAALFDEGHDVPVPRTVSITAILRATAVAQGSPQGGSLVRCSVAVRPYLDDALHGTRVMLTPEHYALRPGSASVTVSPDPGGWSLSTTERTTFRIRYEVLEQATGAVVLKEDVTLSCGPDATRPAPPAEPAPPEPASMEPPPASVDGQLTRLEAEITVYRERESRLKEALDRLGSTPPLPPAPAPTTQITTILGAFAIASLGTSGLLFGAGTALSSNYSAQCGFYIPGGVIGVLGLSTGSVYLMERFKKVKTAVRPAVSLSGQGAMFGARGSF